MFYEPKRRDHGLPFDPFKAIVAPRPIGWICATSARGENNLAPYSFFNAVSGDPPIVMFASDGRKDSLAFIEETGEFVCSLATWDLRHELNATSAPYPRGTDEMAKVGLEPAPSVRVRPPRVKRSPCALECQWLQTVALRDRDGRATDGYVVFGEVVGVHIDDRFIRGGILDTSAMQPIARAGYDEYFVARADAKFSLRRPTAC